MKTFLLAVILIGAVAGGIYYWQANLLKAQAAAPASNTVPVELGPIKLSVTATGRVVSNLDVDIKCKASGEIVKLPYDVSDSVKEGELLVEVDPLDQQRAVDLADVALTSSNAHLIQAKQSLTMAEKKLVTDKIRADAGLLSASAKLARDKIKAGRLKDALALGAATQEDYDTAETDATQAGADEQISKAQVEELKAEEDSIELKRQDIKLAEQQARADQIALDNAKQRLIETKVMAPMGGVVVARAVQKGQIIASAISNVGGGTTVLTLSDLSHVYALGSVDETDIGSVKVDLPVVVTADAYPNRKFNGKVVRIAARGTNVSNVVTFEVKIEVVDDKKLLLKPEMTTNIEIVIAEKESVLLVPADTVSRKKGKRSVTVQKADGTNEEREIETGINDRVKIEVVNGLKEGELIVARKSGADNRWRGDQPKPNGVNPTQMFGGGPGGGQRGGGR